MIIIWDRPSKPPTDCLAQETHVLPRNPLEPLDQRRREPGLRIGNTKRTLRVATLNVATLRDKEEELVLLMLERKIDVLGICETRLQGVGVNGLHHDYQLIYSGGQEKKHVVGVILTPELAQRVNAIGQVNERILAFSIRTGRKDISFIHVYAPQQGRPVEEREDFYREL